jgi:hypothetical protein
VEEEKLKEAQLAIQSEQYSLNYSEIGLGSSVVKESLDLSDNRSSLYITEVNLSPLNARAPLSHSNERHLQMIEPEISLSDNANPIPDTFLQFILPKLP